MAPHRSNIASWSGSSVLHVVLLMVMGMLMLPQHQLSNGGLWLQLSLGDGEQVVGLCELGVTIAIDGEIKGTHGDCDASALTRVADLGSGPEPSAPNPIASVEWSPFMTPAIPGQVFAAQQRSTRRDKAIDEALCWFAAHQRADGSWRFDASSSQADPSSTGPTALAILCFLAAGHTHRDGSYSHVVQHGLNHLLASGEPLQAANGVRQGAIDLRGGGNPVAHAMATVALWEAWRATGDPQLRTAAEHASDGLHAVLEAGISPPPTCGRRPPRNPWSCGYTAWRTVAHQLAFDAGWKPYPESIRAIEFALEWLMLHTYDPKPELVNVNAECRFFVTVLPFGRKDPPDGRYWETTVLEQQIHSGTWLQNRGSWPVASGSRVLSGGRLYETALNCLALATYYHRLRVFQPGVTDRKARP